MEESFRIITLGRWAVGKTTILASATESDYEVSKSYITTLGVDYRVKAHWIE